MSATVNHILVPIDFGPASTRALELGRMLADACGASLHLLHVVGYPLGKPQGDVEERDEALERLNALLNETDRDKRRVTTCCRVGNPAPEIAAYAADNRIDLIVMGTHSHGPTFQMTTGSIAESVLGLATCAVLAAKAPNASSV